MTKLVACPVCGVAVTWNAASKWRPFCSERCKAIDLGDWAAERHRIAGPMESPGDSGALDESGSRNG